jgi:trimethylamine--corrinoid protein Co-methyltransferase
MKFNTPKLSWPLTITEIEKIHQKALDVLEDIGMAGPPDYLIDLATKRGCKINDAGRLCFPGTLIEGIIAACVPRKIYPARGDEKKNVNLDDGLSHFGHQGIAPMVIDFETGRYRDSTLVDLYDFNRLIDALPNLHMGASVVIPGDVPDPVEQMINKIYAAMAATNKHLTLDMTSPDQVEPGLALLEMILGGDQHKGALSPVTFGFCPTKSPLFFDEEFLGMSIEVASRGYPISAIIAAQAGTTAPVTLAGALVMSVAESLGALAAIQIMVPRHPVLLGLWPFISDLRTAAFAGAAPESALLMGGAAQMIDWYGIEGCVAAGMTDAKTVDAQSGYEKGITVALSAIAGAKTVGEAAGMQGSLMAGSFEALVIDDEMLAGINRIKRGIEINDETLSVDVIREVVKGSGNFLYHPQTSQKMRTEYFYPKIADRTLFSQWEENGSPDIVHHARKQTRKLLSSHYPTYIPPDLDAKIRERFNILLPRVAMEASSGRW